MGRKECAPHAFSHQKTEPVQTFAQDDVVVGAISVLTDLWGIYRLPFLRKVRGGDHDDGFRVRENRVSVPWVISQGKVSFQISHLSISTIGEPTIEDGFLRIIHCVKARDPYGIEAEFFGKGEKFFKLLHFLLCCRTAEKRCTRHPPQWSTRSAKYER